MTEDVDGTIRLWFIGSNEDSVPTTLTDDKAERFKAWWQEHADVYAA